MARLFVAALAVGAASGFALGRSGPRAAAARGAGREPEPSCATADECRTEADGLLRAAEALRLEAAREEEELRAARAAAGGAPAAAEADAEAAAAAARDAALASLRPCPDDAARWTLRLNFGREPQTWMPAEFGASGDRLVMRAPVAFRAAALGGGHRDAFVGPQAREARATTTRASLSLSRSP